MTHCVHSAREWPVNIMGLPISQSLSWYRSPYVPTAADTHWEGEKELASSAAGKGFQESVLRVMGTRAESERWGNGESPILLCARRI